MGEVAARPRAGRVPAHVRAMVAVGWLLTLGGAGVVALRMPSLPDEVPLHYGATGTVDGWGDPAALWGLVALWVVLQVMLTVLVRMPHVHNYPVTVTEENAPTLYRLSQELLGVMTVAMGVVLLGMVPVGADGAGTWWLIVLGALGALAATIVGVARMLRVA
ncbi:DUF1648 domain-containing protein [Cellulomonas sp. APG4]|uniref:DUF1648 domain-containing protein n=1 Tax=Cellulomonas sp. APG4 TaxID=1538656 RepID=UPI0013798C65|nr:DUF1648 domain-containing protein [Cellulomonas sp. APG4]NCT92111.1 DUF1648 domain-containing protein [Cellulomonas sp. APG4]